ncbi:MAG TPA: sigma factor [Fimbriiglobus sp.]|jgi:RNA polymerase sigma-70 factor (ECF subfamily)
MKTISHVDQRLSRIDTSWTVLVQAHGESEDAVSAKQQLLERYTTAVRRYLLGAVRDVEVADELSQEFAVRFMRGDLHRADPANGRFRDFVKGVLFHLIADHHRRQKRVVAGLPDGSLADVNAADPAACDRQFVESWREEMLDRSWLALHRHQKETGQAYYTVLQQRAKRPDVRSAEMAEQLSAELGKPVNAAWVRQVLHRAREKFADILMQEVLRTLREPTVDRLEEELIDIGLLEYCRPALDKLRAEE